MRAAALTPFALAIAACAETAGDADRAMPFAPGGRWSVVAIEGAPLPPGVWAAIAREADRVDGHAGCNRFNGSVSASAGSLRFGPIATTRLGCEPPQMLTEAALLAALARVDGARATRGGGLHLTAAGRPVVTLAPAPAG